MNFLLQVPKGLLVFLVLAAGLMLIILAQPPHSICSPQMELFRAGQTGFLYLDSKKSYVRTTVFKRSLEFCKTGNNAGSCFEMSEGLIRLLEEIQAAPDSCREELASLPEVTGAIWQGLELFVRAAWGSEPPRSTLERQGWLDASNMQTYCRLKKFAIKNYGQGQWSSFVESKLNQLPGNSLMPRKELWPRTILSETCSAF